MKQNQTLHLPDIWTNVKDFITLYFHSTALGKERQMQPRCTNDKLKTQEQCPYCSCMAHIQRETYVNGFKSM